MKINWRKITRFHSKTLVNKWQIPQKLLIDHFTNAIIQKVIKNKFVNKYKAYVRMKKKL